MASSAFAASAQPTLVLVGFHRSSGQVSDGSDMKSLPRILDPLSLRLQCRNSFESCVSLSRTPSASFYVRRLRTIVHISCNDPDHTKTLNVPHHMRVHVICGRLIGGKNVDPSLGTKSPPSQAGGKTPNDPLLAARDPQDRRQGGRRLPDALEMSSKLFGVLRYIRCQKQLASFASSINRLPIRRM